MRRAGYTLSEVMVALAISVLVIGGVISSTALVLRGWREAEVSSELNINLELAIERMRQDLRLSSVGVGLMSFYPRDGSRYVAVSFPMAGDSDGDGMLDRDGDNKLIWRDTVIYHIMLTTPNELRRTIFSPRNTNSTPEQLYSQLEAVAVAMSDEAIKAQALEGEKGDSRIIFRNLTRLFFEPPTAVYDGYSDAVERGRTCNFGSVVLDAGPHELRFKVIGKNPESSGYNVNIDRFRLSLSGSPREGEIFLPANTHPRYPFFAYSLYGGSVKAEEMSSYGTSWSGNCQMSFKANGPGGMLQFYVYDDLWCDSNFNEPGGVLSSNCSVKYDTSFQSSVPYVGDKVVSMDKGITWTGSSCGDSEETFEVTNSTDIVSLIYAGTTNDAFSIALNGCWARLYFERPAGRDLYIKDVKIQDLMTGSSAAVTFNIASDWVPMWQIDQTHNYAVSYKSEPNGPGTWGLMGWRNNDGQILSYVNGSPQNLVIGLSGIEVGYPRFAVYRSGVFDTQCDAPAYDLLQWTHIEKFDQGGDIDVRVRSGEKPDCSDGKWTDAYSLYNGFFQSPTADNKLKTMPSKRYVQYEALFECGRGGFTAAHTNDPTAILRDVTVTWQPPLGLVDLEVDFGRGPDCGILEATVDGQEFVKSIVIDLEIYKDGPRGVQTVHGHTEVRPLNTGK